MYRMRIKLLGYLGYMAGRDSIELKASSLSEAIDILSQMEEIKDLLFVGGKPWEGVLFILNGRVVHGDVEVLGDDDELVISLPTAGG